MASQKFVFDEANHFEYHGLSPTHRQPTSERSVINSFLYEGCVLIFTLDHHEYLSGSRMTRNGESDYSVPVVAELYMSI